ncbi:MAG TPA: hypothetical protein PLM14_16655 [Candidatus Hydrogenedentes bacterium]|nr:hypothetical protein [Candidatus Hydrogenedentota bacterium]HQH54511.1 hypothetical protein [Candidatus Hydrogenedentota bacterium]
MSAKMALDSEGLERGKSNSIANRSGKGREVMREAAEPEKAN